MQPYGGIYGANVRAYPVGWWIGWVHDRHWHETRALADVIGPAVAHELAAKYLPAPVEAPAGQLALFGDAS